MGKIKYNGMVETGSEKNVSRLGGQQAHSTQPRRLSIALHRAHHPSSSDALI